jgi:hypothetical protein
MESNNGYRHVMIWVDHREAVVAIFVGSFPSNWLEIYGKGPHPERIEGWLVYRVEAHAHETLKGFHEEVIRHLTPADAILLLGPGQPKHQLAKFVTAQGSHLGHIAQIDTVPRLTEAELVAHAEAFFHVGLGQVGSPK